MSDVLVRIKRAVLAGRYRFSEKASEEMEESGLTELDVVESIVTAKRVYKRIRSTSPWRMGKREYLYVIPKHRPHRHPDLHKRQVLAAAK